MSEHKKIIDATVSIKPVLNWAYDLICKGLQGGSVEITLGRPQEARTVEQNSKMWAMYSDFATQLEWHGEKLSAEEWKILLTNEWTPQQIKRGLNSGFVVFNAKTSKASKVDFSDLVEIIYMWGANLGVKWSEPALKEFEKYRQAQP